MNNRSMGVIASAMSLAVVGCADVATDDEQARIDDGVDALVAQADVPEPPSAAARTAAMVQCPLVDTGAGVTSYDGLAGTYRRYGLVPAGEPVKLTFAPIVDDPDANGTFTGLRAATLGLPTPIGGSFLALPDNPAIGAILGLDTDASGEIDTSYPVLGLHRNFLGQIDAICVIGAAPFQITRSLY